tara:strand:+ start:2178 stop:3032 length:855 start_codon:yes stop_codon:yes gene_type:complete
MKKAQLFSISVVILTSIVLVTAFSTFQKEKAPFTEKIGSTQNAIFDIYTEGESYLISLDLLMRTNGYIALDVFLDQGFEGDDMCKSLNDAPIIVRGAIACPRFKRERIKDELKRIMLPNIQQKISKLETSATTSFAPIDKTSLQIDYDDNSVIFSLTIAGPIVHQNKFTYTQDNPFSSEEIFFSLKNYIAVMDIVAKLKTNTEYRECLRNQPEPCYQQFIRTPILAVDGLIFSRESKSLQDPDTFTLTVIDSSQKILKIGKPSAIINPKYSFSFDLSTTQQQTI